MSMTEQNTKILERLLTNQFRIILTKPDLRRLLAPLLPRRPTSRRRRSSAAAHEPPRMDAPRLPMDPTRLFFRLFYRLDRLIDRLNAFLSGLYILLVVSLLAAITYVYALHLRPLLANALPAPHAALHTAVSVYLLLSAGANYLRCLATSAGRPPADPESAPARAKPLEDPDPSRTRSETWRYCAPCRAPKPPRAHHCSVCAACFYRLCHHCPAFARCIGRDNYPFFFRFVLTAWVGALFAAASTSFLMRRLALPPDRRDVLFFTTIAACAVGVAVGVLAAWHLYLLGTGQTTIEWLENVQMRRRGLAPSEWGRWGGPFGNGFKGNVKEIFGELPGKLVPWWTVLLVPVGRVGVLDENS